MKLAHHILMVATAGWLASGLVTRAQAPSGNPNAPMDPIISQLVRMGAAEGGVAADAEFDPPVAVPGQPVIFRLVVTASPESTAPPDKIPAPPGLDVRAGGSGHSYGFNGQGIQFRTTFIFWVTPQATGSYTLPAFTISANSREVTVPSKTLTVVPRGSPQWVRSARLQVEVPPGNYYIGQKILLPVAALDAGDNSVNGLTSVKGEGDDFIFDTAFNSQRHETRDNAGINVSAFIDDIAAVPVREGKLQLMAQGVIERREDAESVQSTFQGYQPLYESLPVTVTVKHLPKGELPGFTGLIGQFQLNPVTLSAQEVHAGEPVDITVTVSGDGNLERLVPPALDSTPDWQAFPPTTDKAPAAVIEQEHLNAFQYTVIPLRAGTNLTPKIPFSYFDPARGVYVDLTIPGVPLVVLPPLSPLAADDTNLATDASTDQGPPAALSPLAPQPRHLARSLRPLQARVQFWSWQLVPALVLLGLWSWDARRRFLAAHPEVVRRARARRELVRQQKIMRQAARQEDAVAFVRAAVTGLREGCAPQTAANPQALVCEDILQALPPEVTQPATEQLVRQLFGAVERLNFRNQPPAAASLLALQPDLEKLLDILLRRLC